MVWSETSWRGSEPLVDLRGRTHYSSIFTEHVYPMLQTQFTGGHPVLKHDNACVQTCLDEHDDVVEDLKLFPQSPELNDIVSFHGLLENNVHAKFPLPRKLLDRETALHKEWMLIALNFDQNLYLSISRRIQTVIKVKLSKTSTNTNFALIKNCSHYFVLHLLKKNNNNMIL